MNNPKILISTSLLLFLTIVLFGQKKEANLLYDKGSVINFENVSAINTAGLEFSPSYYNNGIVYASSRKKQGQKDTSINETFFELFYSEFDETGRLLPPKEFSVKMNSDLHEGPVTFNRQSNKIYFTRNNVKRGVRKADAQGVTRLKIYEATKGQSDWKAVQEMPFNSDEYSTCHPSLSSNNEYLVFASDMPGGFGGMDLYQVNFNDGIWSKPLNLGPKINTEGHEVFPFVHNSGFLFFSSTGYAGLGGLDLYMTDLMGQDTGKVYSLSAPLNSSFDDLGLILNAEGTEGLVSSNRSGGSGKDDIYRFEVEEGIWNRIKPPVYNVPIYVLDSLGEGLEGAEVHIFKKTDKGFMSGGKSLVKTVLVPSKDDPNDMVFTNIQKLRESLGDPDYITQVDSITLHQFPGENDYKIVVYKNGFEIKEVDFNTFSRNDEFKMIIELEKTACRQLSGFVQSNRSEELSNLPIRITNNETGEHFDILSGENGQFSYCLNSQSDFKIQLLEKRFEPTALFLREEQDWTNVILNVEAIKNQPNSSIGKGTVIILENIYYDFNKSHIRSGDAAELDQLVSLMRKYPSMKIEMTAHTDSRGTKKYNSRLSAKRVESLVQYLTSRGIEFRRINAYGMGEAHLRNHCKDGVRCSDKEHQFNRRTEVKILHVDEPLGVEYRN